MILLAFLACTPEGDTDPVVELPAPRALAEPTGACPDVSESGKVTFTSNGEERDVYVLFPDDAGPNLPVVFYWHPLGGTASMMVN